MRLDKYLTDCGLGSRKEVKLLIEKGRITVNEKFIKSSDFKINENSDIVLYGQKKIEYKKHYYYIMNKPKGYITATEDAKEKTVMELLPNWVNLKNLVPVGRLDKDTEGLLLFTNNGELSHELLSPKKHVKKTYFVKCDCTVTEEAIRALESGVIIDKDYKTMAAKVEKVSSNEIYLEICEGKFHQVKKMLEAVKNEVLFLKRVKFGKLELGNLEIGAVKEVSEEDII